MAINVELLEKTLETIKANPQHWHQSNWHCNSSHCFAGFAELLHFGLPIYSHSDRLKEDDRVYEPVHVFIGNNWNTQDNATEALGLSENDAMLLFDGDNSLEDLESMVKYLVEHGSLPDYGVDNHD